MSAAASTRPAWRRAPFFPLVVGGITLIGLALRLSSFDDSLFGDEVTTYGIVSGHGPRAIVDLVRGEIENTPPLFYLLAGAGERIGGAPEGLRLPSLLAGVLAIPLTYLLGARTVGRQAGTVGAALIALSPFLIFYSTEARSNALVMTLALGSTLALLIAVDGRGPWWWAAYAALSCAAVYTQYSAGFLLLAQFLWAFVVYPRARIPLLVANAAAALAYLPWIGGFLDDRDSPTWLYDTLRPLTLENVWEDSATWMLGHPYVPRSELFGALGVGLVVAGLGLGAASLAYGLVRRRLPRRPSPETVLIVLLAVAVPAGLVIYGELASTVYTPRNLIASSPGLALTVGALVTSGPRLLRVLAAGLCVAGVALGGAQMLSDEQQRPDYAGAAEFVQESGPHRSPVAQYPSPGWGPQTLFEAALDDPHDFTPGGHPVTVFSAGGGQGLQPLELRHGFLHADINVIEALATTRHNGPARQAGPVAKQAAKAGTLFFVTPEQIFANVSYVPTEPPEALLRALPPGFRLDEVRDFDGFAPEAPRVYVFRRQPRG